MSLSTDDIVEIQQLLARYTKAADIDPPETMRDIFAEDGSFVVAAMNLNISGIDNIIAYFTESRANSAGGVFHITNNLIVDGDGDAATASSYLTVMQSGAEIKPLTIGRYSDELIKTNTGWRLKTRTIIL